jgi:hypothetical protein
MPLLQTGTQAFQALDLSVRLKQSGAVLRKFLLHGDEQCPPFLYPLHCLLSKLSSQSEFCTGQHAPTLLRKLRNLRSEESFERSDLTNQTCFLLLYNSKRQAFFLSDVLAIPQHCSQTKTEDRHISERKT